MIKAGIPLAEALDTLVDQSRSASLRKVLSSVLKDVQNGQSLTKSLGKHPKVFDQFFISLIGIGEESGTLEENLEFLSKQMSKDFRLRRKIKGAMMYPAIVVFAMFIMGGFISFFVLPKLVDFFASFEIELPITTKILLFISTMMKDYGYLILAGFVTLIILLRLITRMSKVRPLWHAFLLRVPGAGKMISYGQLSRFARNLGTLIKSGVPITKALDITADTLSNLRFRNDLMEVSKSLAKGKNIGQTLKKRNFFEYPPLVSRMISVGEKTGKLDETLLYLGDFYEDEVDDLSKNLSTLIEPVLLIVIGLAVGFVALAIISPIYELTGSIRR
jgi:type IV pilus assembly protein PilC